MRSTEAAIRLRREALGLTQQEVADRLSVSKGFISHLEHGKRALTDGQADLLAEVLEMPAELLLLNCGRLPQDVQSAIDADPASAAAAVRSRIQHHAIACPTKPDTAPPTDLPAGK